MPLVTFFLLRLSHCWFFFPYSFLTKERSLTKFSWTSSSFPQIFHSKGTSLCYQSFERNKRMQLPVSQMITPNYFHYAIDSLRIDWQLYNLAGKWGSHRILLPQIPTFRFTLYCMGSFGAGRLRTF